MLFPFFSNHGVLGLNARNLLYIKPFNPKRAVAFADDKLKTKAFLAARGIPTAKIYARIESRKQLHSFDFSSVPDECALKPNYGFGGEGILILKGRKNGQFLEQGKNPISDDDMRAHIEDILDGKFSVNGERDTAFFEKLLTADDSFAPFRPAGLPDIRLVVFNLVPVMAMLRIPTAESGGKANVHLGGIGIGIDIAKGITTHATQYNRIIRTLPHGASPAGIAVKHWEEMLLIASRIQYITNIGYLAVDLTIDREQGPILLEVNARAGLMVQVANLAPLRSRLERVGGIAVASPEKGVRIAQDLFGQKLNRRDETPERPILGTRETLVVSGDRATIEVPCLIEPQQERTVFAPSLLAELEGKDAVEKDEQENGYRVKFSLAGKKIQTMVYAGETGSESARAVVGRRDLAGFLIDPAKQSQSALLRPAVREDLRAIDRMLAQADRALTLLKYVKPVNLREERARAKKDPSYNPLFQYAPLPEVDDIENRLLGLTPDASPLGLLLEKKRRELLLRITLLRSRGDAVRFTAASQSLYGPMTPSLVSQAEAALAAQVACALPPPEKDLMDSAEASEIFEEMLAKYALHAWQVSIRSTLVADCTVGGKQLYLREGATFSKEHVDALVAHEVETHILTSENGAHQPYHLLRSGCAHYLDTQEGLAIYNELRVLSPYHEKRVGPARTILAIAFALEHSFAETRAFMETELGYQPDKALTKTLQIKRGLRDTTEAGAFTKGIVYFRGLAAVRSYVDGGGDLKRLYRGKVALEDLETIEQIPGLKPPLLLPFFLREQPAAKQEKKRAAK